MAQVNCPKCGHPVEPSMTECPMCGVIFKKYQAGVLKAQKAFEKKAQQAKQEQLKKLKKCPACSAVISKRAAACPQCGEPQEVPADHLPGTEKKSVSVLVDFQFTSFITPLLVKVVYTLVLVIGAVGVIMSAVMGSFGAGSFLAAVMSYLMLIIITRIGCESALLLFKLEENTRC